MFRPERLDDPGVGALPERKRLLQSVPALLRKPRDPDAPVHDDPIGHVK